MSKPFIGKYMPCDNCGKIKRVKLSRLKYLKHHYCSRKCLGEWRRKNWRLTDISPYKKRRTGRLVRCDFCSKERYKRPSSIRKYNFCNRLCQSNWLSENKSGENHHCYIKDRSLLKTPINQTIRNSVYMERWRKLVFDRDNYTCQLCGIRSGNGSAVILNAHHIKKFSNNENIRFDINNGITLCYNCHSSITWKEYDFEDIFVNMLNNNTSKDSDIQCHLASATP